MKKRTKSIICLVSFIVCLIALARGIDVGSKGCIASSILGLIAISISTFVEWGMKVWDLDD